MAFHAIKAGEGDVFISAGVETVCRFAKGSADGLPDTNNPLFADARRRTAKVAESGAARVARPARGRRRARRLHRDGPDRRERRPAQGRQPRGAGRVRRAGRRTWPRRPSPTASSQREITPVTLPDGTVVTKDDGPRAGVTLEARGRRSSRSSAPTARVTAGNGCPLNDGAAAVVVMSDTKAARARPHPARPHRRHRRHRPVAGDHGPRPGRGLASRRWRAPA